MFFLTKEKTMTLVEAIENISGANKRTIYAALNRSKTVKNVYLNHLLFKDVLIKAYEAVIKDAQEKIKELENA
jgi:hypothetical protein